MKKLITNKFGDLEYQCVAHNNTWPCMDCRPKSESQRIYQAYLDKCTLQGEKPMPFYVFFEY